jgi:subtilase family serine protease
VHTIANWLESRGINVTSASVKDRMIRFSGSVAIAEAAFGVRIVARGDSYANTSDPRVPANFLATIQGILGLSHFATERKVQEAVVVPAYGSKPHFGPTDLYTFYDEAPLLERGIKGTMAPDCIALIETQDAPNDAVDLFVQQFALPPINVTRVLTDPTAPITLATSPEPLLDTEWAHAVAPATPIQLYIGNTPGSSDPVLDAFKLAINDNICGVISASIHTCPHVPKIPEILFYDSLFTQAVVQGQTVFRASGDYGSYFQCANPVTGGQPSVDEDAASPNDTVVGGTQFTPRYDSAGNDLSIVSDGLERVWNEARPPGDKGATGGGMSVIFPKPPWQRGFNVPDDGVRDLPDIALGANGRTMPGFFTAVPEQALPRGCPHDQSLCFITEGGTSIASPMWAGLSRLIAQSEGITRLGNINPRLYELGNLQSATSGLHDITMGNNCPSNDCSANPGFTAGPGFDLVTGWGSPDMNRLVAAFPGATTTARSVSVKARPGSSVAAGQFILTNTTSSAFEVSGVTVTASAPTLFSVVALGATVGSGPVQTALASPSASMTLTFDPPVTIPSTQQAVFALRATVAPHHHSHGIRTEASSTQELPKGAIAARDDFDGTIGVSGLPAMLSSVVVNFRCKYHLPCG